MVVNYEFFILKDLNYDIQLPFMFNLVELILRFKEVPEEARS